VRFAIDFVNGEAIMILIVDHRSLFPEGILDCLHIIAVSFGKAGP
jgi:hypothetical protein